MLSAAHQRFAEAIAKGLNQTEAYLEAYPDTTPDNARKNAPRLTANDDIKAEIERIRQRGQEMAGGAALSIAEVHTFLGRLVRVNVAKIDIEKDGDLLAGIDRVEGSDGEEGILKLKLPCKLGAIAKWADLKGEGAQAGAHEALAALFEKIRK